MKRIGFFAGSFDPLTYGHMDIIERAHTFFDELIIGLGSNIKKQSFLALDDRKTILEQTLKLRIVTFEGLAVNAALSVGASAMVRGIRSLHDYEQEAKMAQVNALLQPSLETLFLLSRPEKSVLSSSAVREIWHTKGDVSRFVPESVLALLHARKGDRKP